MEEVASEFNCEGWRIGWRGGSGAGGERLLREEHGKGPERESVLEEVCPLQGGQNSGQGGGWGSSRDGDREVGRSQIRNAPMPRPSVCTLFGRPRGALEVF